MINTYALMLLRENHPKDKIQRKKDYLKQKTFTASLFTIGTKGWVGDWLFHK